jgi:hypothetical protein
MAYSAKFMNAVRALREQPAQYRTMILHAAMFWSDERLEEETADSEARFRSDTRVKKRSGPRKDKATFYLNAPRKRQGKQKGTAGSPLPDKGR